MTRSKLKEVVEKGVVSLVCWLFCIFVHWLVLLVVEPVDIIWYICLAFFQGMPNWNISPIKQSKELKVSFFSFSCVNTYVVFLTSKTRIKDSVKQKAFKSHYFIRIKVIPGNHVTNHTQCWWCCFFFLRAILPVTFSPCVILSLAWCIRNTVVTLDTESQLFWFPA